MGRCNALSSLSKARPFFDLHSTMRASAITTAETG